MSVQKRESSYFRSRVFIRLFLSYALIIGLFLEIGRAHV